MLPYDLFLINDPLYPIKTLNYHHFFFFMKGFRTFCNYPTYIFELKTHITFHLMLSNYLNLFYFYTFSHIYESYIFLHASQRIASGSCNKSIGSMPFLWNSWMVFPFPSCVVLLFNILLFTHLQEKRKPIQILCLVTKWVQDSSVVLVAPLGY